MKRFFLCTLVLFFILTANVFPAKPKMMSLQVRKGELRSSPAFLGRVVATVDYGDRLVLLEKKGAWRKVSNPKNNAVGWIHSSALTKKRIKLKAGEQDTEVAASSGELALAGKGFNSDVEAEFKTRNKDIDFTWVDKMGRIKVSPKEMRAFLKKGGVEVRQ